MNEDSWEQALATIEQFGQSGHNMMGYDMQEIYKQYKDGRVKYTQAEKRERNDMKKCEVTMPDGNGKLVVGIGCMFISPCE